MDGQKSFKKQRYTSEDVTSFSLLSGNKVYIRNFFGVNSEAISSLMDQARINSLVYLQRNSLGQTLSIFEENNLFVALKEIETSLKLKKFPQKMECYDISHLSGSMVYGSMVVFVNGKPVKKLYRLFKTKERNDDFANLMEVLQRRFDRGLKWAIANKTASYNNASLKDLSAWQVPDLLVIDGGKGQLSSVEKVLDRYKKLFEKNGIIFDTELCSLAKKEEVVFRPGSSSGVLFDNQAKLLFQRIRDEAHRFAITNNRQARLRRVRKSELDQIAGIGPKTKQKLLEVFKSTKNIVESLYNNQQLVFDLVGKSITNKLKKHFGIMK